MRITSTLLALVIAAGTLAASEKGHDPKKPATPTTHDTGKGHGDKKDSHGDKKGH